MLTLKLRLKKAGVLHYLVQKSKKVDLSQLPLLAVHLHSFIDTYHLRIECVKLTRSTAPNSQIENGANYSTSKEIVGDARNLSASNSLQSCAGA